MILDKKLLVLSTHFPPEAEIAAARIKNILKYLLRLGYDLYCVTNTDPGYDYKADTVLSELQLFSAGQTMPIRSERTSFRFLPEILRKHLKALYHLFRQNKWRKNACRLSLKVIREHGIRMVLATVPGAEAGFVGAMIRAKMPHIALICEYRDILSDNRIYKECFSPIEMSMMRYVEMRMLQYASGFVFLTQGIKEHYSRYASRNSALLKGIILTNGYDREIYPSAAERSTPYNKLLISHVGHLYGSRSAVPLVRAVALLQCRKPDTARRLHLNLIGKMDNAERICISELCREYNLTNVTLSGPIPHDAALQVIVDSDVNCIITHAHGSEYALPGKVFEYMGAGRPVLALTRDPLLLDLIRETNLGRTCENSSEAIAELLEEIVEDWLAGRLCVGKLSEKYDLARIVSRLDEYLTQEERCRRIP